MIYTATKKGAQWVVETAKTHGRGAVAIAAVTVAGAANAAGGLADITAGISFAEATAAVVAGYVLLANFGLIIKGGRIVLKSLGLMPR